MFARLMIPPKMVAFAKTKGINLKPCEKLRWTDQHPTRPGIGVLLRGKSSEILTEGDYRWLHDFFDATIETDDPWRVVSAFGDFLRWRYDRCKHLPRRCAKDKFLAMRFKLGEDGFPIGYDFSEFGIRDMRPNPLWPTEDSDDAAAASSSGASARCAPRARKAAPDSARRPGPGGS